MKLVWVILNLVFWTVVLATTGMVISIFEWRGRVFRWIAWMWSKIILFISGVKYTVKGLENLDRKGHYVFTANHESAFDIPLAFAVLPYQMAPISKIELRKIPIFGWAMIMAKHVFVDRRNHEKAIAALRKASHSLKKNPRSVLVFPEGTRSKDGKIHEFKRGGLILAMEAGIPVVPVAMCGTANVITKGSWTINSAPVEIRIGKPVSTEGVSHQDRKPFTASIREKVIEMRNDWANDVGTA